MGYSFKDLVRYRGGTLCLICICAATYIHTTTFMAGYFYGSLLLGAVAAFAIDAGLVVMSVWKENLRMVNHSAAGVQFTIFTVLAASLVANFTEGFISAHAMQFSLDNLKKLDTLQLVALGFGTIVFPILAYTMTDIIGGQKIAEELKPTEPLTQDFNSLGQGTLSNARAVARRNKQERIRELRRFVERNPNATLTQMASAVGVTSKTVRSYLAELTEEGV